VGILLIMCTSKTRWTVMPYGAFAYTNLLRKIVDKHQVIN